MPASFRLRGSGLRTAVRLLVAAALFGTGIAYAQPVFKSTMPDGRVVYGEKPAPGASSVETLEPPPAKSGIRGLTPEEKARAAQLERERAAAAAVARRSERELEDARRALQQAEAARDTGQEPLPGERVGIVGGGSRLTDAYHARQKNLEDAVVAARRRLDEARQALR